ncbi:MAG: hypothetical protein WC554_00945 [Clostridia bacterium]|jgi:hypothetical protein
MSGKKEIKIEKAAEVIGDKSNDLRKQVANIAFTVRKIKNWMEKTLGADLDGDGRVGGGPYKSALIFLAAVSASCFLAGNVIANDYKSNIANWYGTEANPQTYIDKNGNIGAPTITASTISVNGTLVVNNATINTNITVGGKSTLNGELEVNNSDVDINMTLSGNEIDISQTNKAGTASTPLMKITDARTGDTADTADEAALVIDADGVYALTVSDGKVQIEGEIDTASGDLTLTPAGGDVMIEGILQVSGSAYFDGAAIYGQDGTGTNVVSMTLSGTQRGRVELVKDLLIGYGGANAASGDILCYDEGNTNVLKFDSSDRMLTVLGGIDLSAADSTIAGSAAFIATTNIADGDLNGGVSASATNLNGVVPLANGGAGNASGILKANGAGLVSVASSTTDYVAPIAQVSGVTTAALVATVTFQSSIAGVQHLTGWLSESAGGAAVGTNVTSIAGADSTTVLAGGGASTAYAVWTSKADGLSTLEITMTGEQAGLYFNTVQHNGVVVSSPAFDVAP